MRVIKPEKYEDVNKVTELLRHNKTVVLNCENIDEEITNQIIDKITSDIADVQIRQVSSETFVFTSHLVELT